MLIPRFYNNLEQYVQPGRVLVIYGPRRVGKSTLISHYFNRQKCKKTVVSGDDFRIQEMLGSQNTASINRLVGNSELFIIY